MKPLELEFKTNANATGVQWFRQIKSGTTPEGKTVYVYERVHAEGNREGRVFGYEVVTPSVKRAGTYPLPGGKTITYAEDFEEYPGASKFGFSAWSFPYYQKGAAIWKFEQLTAPAPVKTEPSTETPAPSCGRGRGRPKAERPPLNLPEGEFSVTEVAQKNGVEYVVAFQFVKDKVTEGVVKKGRKERRAARGPETQLYFTQKSV